MYKAAIIGVSGFGATHYQDLMSEVAAGRLKAVAATIRHQEKEPEKCEKLRLLGCKLFRDYKEMLSEFQGRIDLCFIPTGIHLHAPMSIDTMLAGSNVFVEKPAAATIQDVRAMQATEYQTKKFVAVGYQSMYADNTLAIKRLLIEKQLGRIQSIKGMGMGPRGSSYYERNPWAGKIKLGKHIILDSPFNNAFAHYLNLMCFFAGSEMEISARPKQVQAELFRARDIESCDTACMRIETEEGIRLHFFVTHSSKENLYPVIQITGELGTLEWEMKRSSQLRFNNGFVKEIPLDDSLILRKKVMAHIIDRLKNKSTFICTLNIAAAQTICVNAAHKSSIIKSIPRTSVKTLKENNNTRVIINGIDEIIPKAFETGKLFSELGVKWAANMKTKPVEIASLKEF